MRFKAVSFGLAAVLAFACSDTPTEPLVTEAIVAPSVAIDPGLNGENLMHAQPLVTEPMAAPPFAVTTSVATVLLAASVIEDFESAVWPYAGWVAALGSGGATSAAAAWQGAFGFVDPGAGWYRNTATNVGFPGDKIAMRVRFVGGQGRTYLAFDATAAGAKSLVFAPNSGDIRFQRNTGYGFQELNITPFAAVDGTWYKLELEFVNANDVIGRLYDETGAALLATVAQTYAEGINPENIGLRSFAGHQSDYITDETAITVEIDIKPGSDPNSINLKNKGVVPVAILGSDEFDVNDIDRTTLAFGPGGAAPTHAALGHLEDVNDDGYVDLLSHYRQQEAGLMVTDTDACVSGETLSSVVFEGCDAVSMLGATGLLAYVTEQDEVSVLNAERLTVTDRITVGVNPRGLDITPDGAFAYVTNFSSRSTSVIETGRNTVIATVPVGRDPGDVEITPDGAFAYVTNSHGTLATSSVSVIETATNQVIATIPMARAPLGIAVTPDGAFVYVANLSANLVSVIEVASNTVVATIPAGDQAGDNAPMDIVITPDGHYAYVTKNGGGATTGTISMIEIATNSIVETIPLTAKPRRLAITPDGSAVYIAAAEFPVSQAHVFVLETATNTVTTDIPMGLGTVADVAVTPDGASVYALFSGLGRGEIRVIDTTTRVVTRTKNFVPAGRISFK